ncbi:hypothetical protein HanPSC8_Chr15g0678531 [Helianthus annuus]|nr:hypothetical protein HanPSC8_Chr15g0678531 [Helianthus annuus]
MLILKNQFWVLQQNPRTDAIISNKPLFCSFKIPKRSGSIFNSKSSNSISTPRAINKSNEADSMGKDCFARISSSSDQHTSSVGATPQIAVIFTSVNTCPISYFSYSCFVFIKCEVTVDS